MNNYFTLRYLTQDLSRKLKGATFTFSYSPHKDVWEGYFNQKHESIRLVFCARFDEIALFANSFREPKKTNVTRFFETLAGEEVTDIRLSENDRIVTILFSSGSTLLFQLFGHDANAMLVRDGLITESFKNPDSIIGSRPAEPRPPRERGEPQPDWGAKKTILHTEPKFPRHLVGPVIQHFQLDEKEPQQIAVTTRTLVQEMTESAVFRVLDSGNLCLLPNETLPLSTHKSFDDCNDAVRYAYYQTSRQRRLHSRMQSLKPRFQRELKRSHQTIQQLEGADKALERAEQYEQFGHLLMANAHQSLQHGTESLRVQNFYDEGEPIDIPLKEGLSIAENAQHYYQKSKKAETRVAESKKRLARELQKRDELQRLHEELLQIEKVYEFDEWYDEQTPALRRLNLIHQQQETEKRPYRRGEVDGFEIWIGKNASSNDELTMQAHKEDVWLHARGVSGSHVVIRMNNDTGMPPKPTLLKAAAVAAWNSKARGSALVPVIVTKRKYVVKSKRMARGAVRVEKENVEMVKPAPLT
ncbi:MAG: NFACT RNA binding domain-containing protein [Balneolaceae bacterium]